MSNHDASTSRELGIILHYQGRNITVFDRNHHRRDLITYQTIVSPSSSRGSFISYLLIKEKNNYILSDVRLEYMPLVQARLDIYFLHSLLEICYHFIPADGVEVPIYSLLLKVFRSFEFLSSSCVKKSILCLLFARLGMYPSDSHSYRFVEVFLQMPIDNVIEGNLELADEDFLNTWLTWCIGMYPQGKKCKSLSLLLQKR